ncbi:MAG: thioesterase family protein [Pseudomonadota bacterium]
MTEAPDTPVFSPLMELQPDWIDYNGHLNMAFYNVLFDRGCDVAFEDLGMGPDYATNRKLTIYTAEAHVRYVREVHLGDKVQVSAQILDHDEKRLHIFQELRHSDGWLSATSETIALHVDMTGPKVAPFPEDIASLVNEMAQKHARLPYPENAGRRIEIRRK